MLQRDTSINAAAYRPLLSIIAKGESNGNFNAYFGNANNQEVRFTDMTIAEVLQWQAEYVQQGSASNAVGRYQIIRPTLVSLVDQLQLDTSRRFDEDLQNYLAITLMERRGAKAFIENKLSPEQFAHELSKEWAALPRVIGDNPEQSYYAGDGLNASRIRTKEILNEVGMFKALATS